MTPTSRTLAVLRELGYTAQIVERWNPHAKIRQDLFGIVDVLAIHPGERRILGVQATSSDHHAHREAKATASPNLLAWLEAGGEFEVWSWAKRGERGKRKLWTLRRTRVAVRDGSVVWTVLAVEA